MGLYSCGSKWQQKQPPKVAKMRKVKNKLNNEVFLDEKRWAKMQQEIPKILQITRATLCDKYKVNGSIARAIIRSLSSAGSIKRVGDPCASFDLYTGTQAKSALEKAAEEAAQAAEKDKKKG